MKKWLLIIGITLGIISQTEVNAQIVKVNISSQPLWGPVGYNYVEYYYCLLYTSDAADERSSVDLGGRRIIKKKNTKK